MATKYYQRDELILKDDGQEQWCLYNPKLRDWQRHERVKRIYERPDYDGFEELTEAEALKAIAKDQQEHDRFKEWLRETHPDEFKRDYPDEA